VRELSRLTEGYSSRIFFDRLIKAAVYIDRYNRQLAPLLELQISRTRSTITNFYIVNSMLSRLCLNCLVNIAVIGVRSLGAKQDLGWEKWHWAGVSLGTLPSPVSCHSTSSLYSFIIKDLCSEVGQFEAAVPRQWTSSDTALWLCMCL